MPRGYSTYLDGLRFLAAMMVVCSHFRFQFPAGMAPLAESLGDVAIAVFFALSGYVISYVADQKEPTLKDFAISRLARIYSVAIPALILTVAVDTYLYFAGSKLGIPAYEYVGFWKYLPVFLSFTSEIGPLHVAVLTDSPFWSLSYEVWYYIAFAVFTYLRGWPRIVLLTLLIPVLGIRALIYLPIWLLGCACYWAHQRILLPKDVAGPVAILTFVFAFVLWFAGFFSWLDKAANLALGGWPATSLNYSASFPIHYVVGVLAVLHLFAIRYCALPVLQVPAVRRAVTYAASFTFAIYLGHQPLKELWSFLIVHNAPSIYSGVLLLALTLISVWLFGLISEHRKREWHSMFSHLFDRVAELRHA